jgi:DNA-binding IclR family transcriptional regulator
MIASMSVDAVPALARGLHLMHVLEARGTATLEEPVRTTALPRSSVARILETLGTADIAERGAGLRWRLTRHLVTLPPADPLAAWSSLLPALARRLSLRLELWRFDERGCELASVVLPEGWPVPMYAHPGWRPDLHELIAPVQLWIARRQPGLPGAAWYWADDRRIRLSQSAVRRLADRVRLSGVAGCPARNHIAIRRWAVALLAADGQTIGCLSAVRFCLRRRDGFSAAVRAALQAASSHVHCTLNRSLPFT